MQSCEFLFTRSLRCNAVFTFRALIFTLRTLVLQRETRRAAVANFQVSSIARDKVELARERHRDYFLVGWGGRGGGKACGGNSKKRTLRGGGSGAFNLRLSLPLTPREKKLRLRGNKAAADPFETSIENRAALSRRFARAEGRACTLASTTRYIHEGSFVRYVYRRGK